MAEELKAALSPVEALEKAKEAEADGELEQAAGMYERVINEKSIDDFPYDRLMIIYRKLKQYKDELRIINKAIKLYEDFYKKPVRKSAKQQKLATLSNAFIKSAGLKDKKGNLLYVPEPISRWMKRKAVVEKKLKK